MHLEEFHQGPAHGHVVFDDEYETGVLGHQYAAV
jgi:hypothetical protein